MRTSALRSLTFVRALFALRRRRRRRAQLAGVGCVSRAEEQMAAQISAVLRFGVLLSAAIVSAGAVSLLMHEVSAVPLYDVFRGEPEELREAAGILREAAGGSARGLIQLGVLVLLATPVARVALSLVSFAVIGDRTYTIIAAVVLAILAVALAGDSTWIPGG